jgi:membrane protein DedA with SNARE-associated domain
MFAEGPAVSFICAFLAAQGFFSFGLVYLFSIFGDLVGDVMRYWVGRFARRFGAQNFLEMQEK